MGYVRHQLGAQEIQEAYQQAGTINGAAQLLGVSRRTMFRRLEDPELRAAIQLHRDPASAVDQFNLNEDKSECTFTTPPNPNLGDLNALIRDRGLDPDEWIVASVAINRWDAPVAGGGKQTMEQAKISLRRSAQSVLAAPAQHVPSVKRKPHIAAKTKPELIVVESDSQIPYIDKGLHEASLYAIQELYRRHNMVEHVFLGDVADFPTISKHAPHAAAMATVNECIQGSYNYLRDKAEAAPNARRRLLKGNHDYRLESELLNHAQGVYGIKPAGEEMGALSMSRLLHFDALGIEYVEDPRGWQHGEIELVDGVGGLVCRHGWITSANSALKSMQKRGRSIIVGHNHRREHAFWYDPSAGIERQGVVIGCMSAVRGIGADYPTFTVCDDWNQGFGIVTRWPDQTFSIEHALWDGHTLRWRDMRWTA